MIRFSRYIWLYTVISASVLVPGVFSLIRYHLRPSIDFTGGTLLEVRRLSGERQPLEDVARETEVSLSSVQVAGGDSVIIRLRPASEEKIKRFQEKLFTLATPSAEIIRQETVGPVLGSELLVKAFIASLLAIVGIFGYVAYAFRNIKYGVSAIVALFHDLLVVLGTFSLLGVVLGVEVDTLFVTAFLTTMSFSVHDTIVVFDRIREYRKRSENAQLSEIADRALTETMGRSLTNSFTIIFMLLALVLLGGNTIRWFAVALLIGTISGTYSSPFVATPILLLWDRWERRKK